MTSFSRITVLLLLITAVVQLSAQNNEADRKLLAEIRAQAEKGDAESQCHLGVAFDNGKLGLAKDEVEGVKWYRKAAEQNLAEAQSNLGACYAEGSGVVKDDVEAVRWYRKAAEQNYASAQFRLGDCYASGRGVAKNYVEAYEWTLLAAAQDNDSAKKLMTILENEMSREQIADGQKLARNFKPRSDREYEETAAAMATKKALTERRWLSFDGHRPPLQLTAAINRAKDSGDLDTLRQIASDPHGFMYMSS